MAHTFDNNPNTGLPFSVLTSYNSDIFASAGDLHGGGDAGFGSLLKRDVATDIVMYRPYRNALDTLIQTTGGFDVAKSSVHEWIENDELLPDEAVMDTAVDANDINHGSFVAANTGTVQLSADNAKIFREGDVVRYVTATGSFVYALVTDITGVEMTLTAFDEVGTNRNIVAATGAAVIERLHSLRGSDLNYDVQARGTIPKAYYTYINNMAHDARMGRRVQNEEHFIDLVNDTETKLFAEMRRSRELQALYGYKGKITLGSGDTVYSSPGLYDQISDFNKDTAGFTTGGVFDATKFKNAIYDFIAHNFGGESGGPETRTMFISGRFADFLSRAFVDEKRFYEVEYIAGVRVMRWEHNLGNIDFVYLPVFDYKHPIPGGSLKQATPKAVGMLCPIQDCVVRLVKEGEGPASEMFKEKGGDVEMNMRVTSTEGLKLRLKQYCSVLEEI